MSSFYISNCCEAQVTLIDEPNGLAVCQSCKEPCELVLVED